MASKKMCYHCSLVTPSWRKNNECNADNERKNPNEWIDMCSRWDQDPDLEDEGSLYKI
jgi:hypothetical protein